MRKMLIDQRDAGMRASPGATPAVPTDPEAITISIAASAQIRKQAQKRGTPDAAIRVGIRGGGCTGFSYIFDWEDGDGKDGDHWFEQHGVRLVVDKKSFKFLKGTELDFASTLMSQGFKFNNPNAKGTCGCGESVSF